MFQLKKKKHRVEAVEFWIEVARECVNIGNFNSMMGIITGLNMFPVARLKKTVREKNNNATPFMSYFTYFNPTVVKDSERQVYGAGAPDGPQLQLCVLQVYVQRSYLEIW
jgi:hypothetical protein